MKSDWFKIAAGIAASLMVAALGWLARLPTQVELQSARIEVLDRQLTDTLAVIDALHPRGSALAGGPPESDDEMQQRDAKLRALMKRAPAVIVENAPPPCPPCPCECPEPTPTPTPEPTP